jgi:hypothetical protein
MTTQTQFQLQYSPIHREIEETQNETLSFSIGNSEHALYFPIC